MKEIKTNIIGMHLVCDDEDFDFLRRYRWWIMETHGNKYAYTYIPSIAPKGIAAHTLLLNPDKGITVDHYDGNGLNCQRENLRLATHQQNQCNKGKQKGNYKSKYKGVTKCTTKTLKSERWFATLFNKNKRYYLGCYKTEEEAAKAYDVAAIKYHGEYANLNFPGPRKENIQ